MTFSKYIKTPFIVLRGVTTEKPLGYMSTLLIPKQLQFTTKDKIVNMSNDKNSENKDEPAFHTTLRKIKKQKESI